MQRQVPILKPTELFEKRKNRDTSRLKAYNQILEQIHARILSTSKNETNAYLLYTVPPFILGLPRLDLEDCIIYIVYQLRQQAYEVRYTYPNLLYISWLHHEREYLQKQSPIMQAMTPLHVEKKQQATRVRFGEELRGQGQGQGQQPQSILKNVQPQSITYAPPGRAPPRSVNEYKPPTSFLDVLERPINPLPTKKDVMNDLWNF
jgi:hypothetical protein